VAGSTGSGKTHALRRLLLPKFPRVVLVDFVGEWERRRRELPGQITVTQSLGETRAAMVRCASLGRWSIVAQLAPQDFPQLARWLVPEKFTDATPIYPRLVRGCALFNDEFDLVASHSAPPEVFSLFRRGRHVGLSICAATHTPSSVHPLVRGLSRYLMLCQMHEVNSIKYFAAVLPPDVFERLENHLPPRELLIFDTHTQRAVQLSGDNLDHVLWRWEPNAVLDPA